MKATLIFLIFLVPANGLEVNVLSNLVQDLISNEKVPSVLSVFTCWSKFDQQLFVKSSKIPVQLSNRFKIQPRISDDRTNKLWYFIDVRCVGSYKFLHGIDKAYFAHPYRWIMFEPVEERMVNLTLLPDSNVIFVHFNADQSRFHLKQGKMVLFSQLSVN